MPVQTSYPGVYIEERPSGVRTITGVSTSVTAFVGACSFGDVNRPVRVTSIAEFQRRFGPPVSAAEPLGHMVGHYFINGGSEAIIVRVTGAGAAPATATLQEATPADTLILAAASPGTWANPVGSSGLTAVVDHATANPNDSFNLTLRLRSVNPATGNVELTAEERFENVSMSPASQRFVNLVLEVSDLVDVDATSPAPGGTAQGASTGLGLPASNPIGAANSVLRLALDFGPPLDLTLPAGNHTRDQLRTEVENAVDAAGLAITVTLASNALVLQSDATGPNSSVVVLPAPLDASATLRLGRANGGVEVSGAAALRPTPGTTAFDGGTPGAAVGATDVVPASGAGGIFSLNVRTFPRFNLLVLPGVTSNDQQEVGAALAYCRDQRAFLIVDTPAEAAPGDWVTDPPALGSLPAQGEHGALYYPRLTVFETRPGGRREELDLPPAGAIAGVFATTDRNRGVWKAPAGRAAGIVGISDLTTPTDDDLSGQLNPLRRERAAQLPRCRDRGVGRPHAPRRRCHGVGVQVRADPQDDRLHRQLALPRHGIRRVRTERSHAVGAAAACRGDVHAPAVPAGGVPAERQARGVGQLLRDLRRDGEPAGRDRPRASERRRRLRPAEAGRVRHRDDHPDLGPGGMTWPSSSSTAPASTPTSRTCSGSSGTASTSPGCPR